MALIVLYLLHRTSVFSFYIDVVLTLSIRYDKYLMAAMAPNRRWAFAKILMVIVKKCRWRCLLTLYVVYETVLYFYDKWQVFHMLCMYSYQIYAHYSLSISHIYISQILIIFFVQYIFIYGIVSPDTYFTDISSPYHIPGIGLVSTHNKPLFQK